MHIACVHEAVSGAHLPRGGAAGLRGAPGAAVAAGHSQPAAVAAVLPAARSAPTRQQAPPSFLPHSLRRAAATSRHIVFLTRRSSPQSSPTPPAHHSLAGSWQRCGAAHAAAALGVAAGRFGGGWGDSGAPVEDLPGGGGPRRVERRTVAAVRLHEAPKRRHRPHCPQPARRPRDQNISAP